MALDTKLNLNECKFEQLTTETLNLSGCTNIFGNLIIKSGGTISILDNHGMGKVFTSDDNGNGFWGEGFVTGFTNGLIKYNNQNVCLGTPSDIDNTTINLVTGTTHTHKFKSSSFVRNDGGILVDGAGRFYLDDSYVSDTTLPNLYTITGITSNQSIGILESGQTLGMVYITNLGSEIAYVNLGTTPTGDEITPYTTIKILPNDDVSVTINMRLSKSLNKTIYISSSDWNNIELEVQWANITYQNASTTITPSDLPMASDITLGAIRIGDGISIDGDGIVSVDSIDLNNISDVSITTPSIGNLLMYNGSNWVNSGLTITTNLSELTDVSINSPAKDELLVYDGNKWINTGITTGGGFLGLVTKTSSKPSNLKQNQWVKPRPEDNNNLEYTFTNFCDSLGNPINVNLSLEDVYLRYCESGNYWTKEYYDKPLTYDKTWIGSYENKVCEIPVIDEWVSSEEALCHIGQKFSYKSQTIMVNDLDTCISIPNNILIENINLKNVGNTKILTVPSGKRAIINDLKLIMLQQANPTTLTINVGSGGGVYNNLINGYGISNICQYEVYSLPVPQEPNLALNSDVYLRVVSGSTHANELCGHLLVNAFIF